MTSNANSINAPLLHRQVAPNNRSERVAASIPSCDLHRDLQHGAMVEMRPREQLRPIAPAHTSHAAGAHIDVSYGNDSAEDDNNNNSSSDQVIAASKKARKRTYYRRKEETAVLLDELHDLEVRAAFFRERQELAAEWRRIRRQQLANRSLRCAIRSQRLVFANARSMTAQFMQQTHTAEAYESRIRLGADPAHRRAALLALKREKLDDAAAFVVAYAQSLDLTRSFVDAQRFETASHDFVTVRFDATPFFGLASARPVYDAYMSFAKHMEINVSATLGDITIREDDDDAMTWDDSSDNSGVAHHRMVSTITDAVALELNSAIFAEFVSNGSPTELFGDTDHTMADERGVVVFDYIDDDALYPYRPTERVRQDVTCFAVVTSFWRHRSSAANSTNASSRTLCSTDYTNDKELVVVLLRWSLLRIHHSAHLPIPDDVRARMRNSVEHVRDSILTSVHQAVRSLATVRVPIPGPCI